MFEYPSKWALCADFETDSGPNAHLIQYCVQSRTMSTFQSASSDAASWQRPSRYVLPPETDVFDALRTHMSQYTLADQHAVLSSLELHDSTDLLNIPISALPLQSESPPLEFNLLGGWVGYLGYELRRETEPAGDSTLHSASFQCVSDAARRSLIDQHYSQPDLSLVFADRYLGTNLDLIHILLSEFHYAIVLVLQCLITTFARSTRSLWSRCILLTRPFNVQTLSLHCTGFVSALKFPLQAPSQLPVLQNLTANHQH
jgi:hypothetical protein